MIFCHTMSNGLLVSDYMFALTVRTALFIGLVHSLHTMVMLGSSHCKTGKSLVKVKNSSQKIFSVICQPTVGQQRANIQLNIVFVVSDLSVGRLHDRSVSLLFSKRKMLS